MESINLYYNENLIRKNKDAIWIGIPVEEITMDFYLKGEQINLYQEIILRLFKCGYGDKKSIEEVLKFSGISEGIGEEENDLIDYILKELETLGYIQNGEITEKGKEALLEIDIEHKEDKALGSVFYNIISQEYENYIEADIKNLYGKNYIKKKEIEKEKNGKKINFGTTGNPIKIEIDFLEGEMKSKINSFSIEDLVKIKREELRSLNNELGENDLREKIEFLKDLRKYIKKDSKLSYLLVGIDSNGNVLNSFYPNKNDRGLKIELEKIKHLKTKFKEKVEEKYGIDKGKKREVKRELREKERIILEESGNKLEEAIKLVQKLSILYYDEDNVLEERYKRNIPLIYESFAEVFNYLLRKYSKNRSLIKNRNIELALKNIFKDNYPLDKELTYFYTSNIASNISEFILESEELINLFRYAIYLENRVGEEKLENYLKEHLEFFSFIKKLIPERNRFNHSGENQEYQDEDVDFEFEAEGKKILVDLIETIFEFKFNNSLNTQTQTLDENLTKNIKKQCEKEIEIEFAGVDNLQLLKKLINLLESFKYYESFKNLIYKKEIIMSIGKLLEATLKMLRNKIEGKHLELLEFGNNNSKTIKLSEVDKKFFNNSKENGEIDFLFDKIKTQVEVQKKKVIRMAFSFKNGTLNTYALALLYSSGNFLIKEIIEKYPEFFKLVFIVSDLRGHSGKKFLEKTDENIERDIKKVEEFMKEILEIIKKILIEIGK